MISQGQQVLQADVLTSQTYEFIGDRFILVEETRSIGQIIEELKGVVQEQEECPFCLIFESPDVETNVIGDDFFGGEANIQGIRCCGDCAATVEGMGEEYEGELVAMVKQAQEAQG